MIGMSWRKPCSSALEFFSKFCIRSEKLKVSSFFSIKFTLGDSSSSRVITGANLNREEADKFTNRDWITIWKQTIWNRQLAPG